jgi:pimeloyl-ACP methyl ester carboxylesterase
MRTILLILAGIPVLLALALGVFVAATWAPERAVAELKARWAPPPSVFVDVAGMQVHLRDEGPRDDPSPIVLLHGMGSSLHAWEGWAAALRDQRRVITLDLPGYGLTGPSPDGVYGRERDAAFVLAVLDRLGVARAVLGGNSLGAGLSLRIALTHPGRVDKLILVDGGSPARSSSMPIGLRILETPGINWLLQHTLPRFLVEQGLRNTWGDPAKVTQEHVDRAVELTQREGNRRAIIARFTQRRPGPPARPVTEVKVPTLIMWGGRDRLVPPEAAYRLNRAIAGSILAIFDELGHAPEEEDPERTVAAVKRFLGIE